LRRTLLWRLALALLTVGIVSAFASYRTALKEANQAHDRTLLASTRSIAERIHVTNGRVTVNVLYGALDTFQIDARGGFSIACWTRRAISSPARRTSGNAGQCAAQRGLSGAGPFL
jgi:Tfp pilus assembly protein PilE